MVIHSLPDLVGLTSAGQPLSSLSAALARPVFYAALLHFVQIPAMRMAARRLAWCSRPEDYAINRRIESVLRLTIPISFTVLAGLSILNHDVLISSRLGVCLSVFVTGQLALIARRRFGSADQQFAKLRSEVVYLLCGLGILVLSNTSDVATTRVGRELCWALAVLFACRAALQLLYYAKVWPPGVLMRLGHWGLGAFLFPLQSAVYLGTALRVL
jgi:hypothetical protein